MPKPQSDSLVPGSNADGKPDESLEEGSNRFRDRNPTQRRAEEKLDHERDKDGAKEGTERHNTPPSALFNGA
jgi:hypothetical protein